MAPLAFLGSLGTTELVVILVILMFLFGGSKLPGLARGLGEGIRNFRTSLKGGEDESASDAEEEVEKTPNSGN